MNFTQYQTEAMSFRLRSADYTYAMLNLGAEAGEVLALEAKMIRDGGNVEEYRRKLKKELGDVLWHIAAIAADNHMDLEDVATANIEKLTSRKANNSIKGNGDER
jgi:NTP pyrophosphatase (non-canonical NTP hydrolase)